MIDRETKIYIPKSSSNGCIEEIQNTTIILRDNSWALYYEPLLGLTIRYI
jgi:hypothetical protein